ncbi:MAG: SDR family NAD(P)-dependent oxidoreductase [Tatlockia sp.]|jgi:NAD(P)-dependent dehydrogenase (short-subunit alcohol dehydrogenase family)
MFLITGGGSGIGRALAQAIALRGKDVLIVGRRNKALLETAAFSPLIQTLCADVSSQKGREAVGETLAQQPALEGLIHNAGIIDPIEPLATLSATGWQQILATNLTTPFLLTQSLLPKVQEGRVLHIGSGAAYFPVKGWAGYCVSKAGLSMLTRCWQLENPSLALTSVMPGIIDTDMQHTIRNARQMDEEKQAFFIELHQKKQLLTQETVALFLSWLLLDTSKETYVSKEWDIYDKTHHAFWLKPPHQVLEWE